MRKVFYILAFIFVISLQSKAAVQVDGLICDNGSEVDKIEIVVKPGGVTFLRFKPAMEMRYYGQIKVSTNEISPILKGDLASMNNKTFKDAAAQSYVQFKVAGRDVDNNPRLAAQYVNTDKRITLNLTGCHISHVLGPVILN